MYPLVVLVVGVIVTTPNLVRASATTIQISWILLLIGIVLAVLYVALDASAFGVFDRRPVASARFSPWLR